MLRIFIGLFFLSSCSLGVIKSGGSKKYTYQTDKEYTLEEIKEVAPEIVTTLKRHPNEARLDELFSPPQRPIKKVGIVIFESSIQQTRDGLSGEDKIYFSEQGKQLLTERLLEIWEKSFAFVSPGIQYFPTSQIKKAASFHQYGSLEDDYIKARRTSLAPDDVFYRPKGKNTTSTTILNPRGMRDLSFMLVPATELMSGPKWSEHQKHFVNDIAKELNLDAVIIVMSNLSWHVGRMDKHSGEHVPEELKVEITSSVLIPLSDFHKRLEVLNIQAQPKVTLCYRSYEVKVGIPVDMDTFEKKKDFATIEEKLLGPALKVYRDLSLMTLSTLSDDLKKTH